MDIIVFGAAGRLGSSFVEQALAHGHRVTAFVRNPAAVTLEGVTTVQGDAFDADAVRRAIAGHDVVVSALATTKGAGHDSLRRMASNIAEGMRAEGVRRIVWCASEGVDREIPGLVGKLVMGMLAKPLADHRAALATLGEAGLSVTVARPRSLSSGPLDTSYTEVVDGPASGGWSISRASVAHWMLKAVEDHSYEGTSVALTSRK